MRPLGHVQATSFALWDKKKGINLTVWARFVKYHSDPICIDIPRVSLMGLLWPFHFAAAASLVVKVYPERVLASQGGSVTLRCQVSGSPPHYFYWSREDGRPISSGADRRRQGTSHTWCTYSSMISALFILVWSTVKKKFCSSWSEYTNCVYRYAYKITLQAWTRHLLFMCVCRSRAVLPQRPVEWRRRLRLYLQRPAQHQQEPRRNCCHKCVSPHCCIGKQDFPSCSLLHHTK